MEKRVDSPSRADMKKLTADWSEAPIDCLEAFARWYAETQTGPNRMHTKKNVEQALPGILDWRTRMVWHGGPEERRFLAAVAVDVLDLYLFQQKLSQGGGNGD